VSARLAIGALIAAMSALPALAQNIPVPQKRPSAGTISPPQAPDKPAAPSELVVGPQEQEASEPKASPVQAPVAGTAAPAFDAALRRAACPAVLTGAVLGEVGPPLVQGECGTDSPVTVTAIGDVRLGGDATMTCGMATALAALMPDAVKAASDILGSPLVGLQTGSGFECRNRNGDGSGKLSQHAFANALDVAAFKLADGRSIAVGESWPHLARPAGGEIAKAAQDKGEAAGEAAGTKEPAKPAPVPPEQRAATPQARFLVTVHKAACSVFSTVLGPDANAAHHDHFHFDLGCHGKDCKYLICE